MTVFIFVVQNQSTVEELTDNRKCNPAHSHESLQANSEDSFATATALLAQSQLVVNVPPLTKAERKRLGHLSEAVCQKLRIVLWETHLVSLIGGHAGMTNGDAVALWCLSMLLKMTDGTGEVDLADNLAARLKKQLLNKMH